MHNLYPILICTLLCIVKCYGVKPGPAVIATKGSVWPKPQLQNGTESFFVIRPTTFKFKLGKGSSNCNLLQNGLERYWNIIQENTMLVERQLKYQKNKNQKKSWWLDKNFLGYLDQITINLTDVCNENEYPSLIMDETYKLWIAQNRSELRANSVWGILRGLETFSQLIYVGSDGLVPRVNSTTIKDFPRYKHRGLLIDTSRHFIPLNKIYETLDALSYNKMNVLHWHIVDDPSFPYVSKLFPELSERGAFNPHTKVYFPEDIQNVIEYARVRGIRVLPEFDSPGHTASWGVSHPELLTPCEIFDSIGPMNPINNGTYTFLGAFLAEIRDVFKDDFIHLGGDEVEFTCWEANKNISDFMKKHNITSYNALESYYVQKVLDIARKLKFKSIVWEEVFENEVQLSNNTVVHVWKGDWRETMKKVTQAGKFGLLSACWYLDNIGSGGDWDKFYYCDPSEFDGTQEEQELVLGGEACMWGEVVNEYNIISRTWPRASAVAEKLWSAYNENYDLEKPAARLEEHTCRMNRRNIGAQPPNGPSYCD